MSPPGQDFDKRHLPARIPDLTVVGAGDRWHVRSISPRLAGLAAEPAEALRGRRLGQVFAAAVPPLEELAREAAGRDEPLQGIPVRIRGPEGTVTLAATIHPGGLSADYRSRELGFFFAEAAAPPRPTAPAGLVGVSPGLQDVLRKIDLYAGSGAPVVVTGETGTGKELVARALHRQSPRRHAAFVAVNCTAVAEDLLESELFGHEKGAFTGAVRSHRGRFERADGGTLFLDEIGDMPLKTQAKLLRVLEDGMVERVGAEQARPVDVRVVAATNVSLEQAVYQGRFRADLYHRLAVLRIHLPPLRERPEDIPLLVDHFLAEFNDRYGRRVRRLTPDALALLQSYAWPGNIRELRNVLERIYVENAAEAIGSRALAEWVRERQDFLPGEWNLDAAQRRSDRTLAPPYPLPSERPLLTGPDGREPAEAWLLPVRKPARSTRPAELDVGEIRRAWRVAGGNLSAAARLLGVHRATLYRYLNRLGLSREGLDQG